jgi:hypothetical protein
MSIPDATVNLSMTAFVDLYRMPVDRERSCFLKQEEGRYLGIHFLRSREHFNATLD